MDEGLSFGVGSQFFSISLGPGECFASNIKELVGHVVVYSGIVCIPVASPGRLVSSVNSFSVFLPMCFFGFFMTNNGI